MEGWRYPKREGARGGGRGRRETCDAAGSQSGPRAPSVSTRLIGESLLAPGAGGGERGGFHFVSLPRQLGDCEAGGGRFSEPALRCRGEAPGGQRGRHSSTLPARPRESHGAEPSGPGLKKREKKQAACPGPGAARGCPARPPRPRLSRGLRRPGGLRAAPRGGPAPAEPRRGMERGRENGSGA